MHFIILYKLLFCSTRNSLKTMRKLLTQNNNDCMIISVLHSRNEEEYRKCFALLCYGKCERRGRRGWLEKNFHLCQQTIPTICSSLKAYMAIIMISLYMYTYTYG